ncbi:hypothetical protein FNV43_RR06539 [Rhamnella rubrinervis]|uniref:Protein kinase domain-containing protein n=1 Tax=Rhamnella rubrinervis TaxID=2594499 RepID=A0A8K0MLD8_9ROSA|nr:hypothetical protein FNV43_RR06539 [Rhamnella rubrinervis]
MGNKVLSLLAQAVTLGLSLIYSMNLAVLLLTRQHHLLLPINQQQNIHSRKKSNTSRTIIVVVVPTVVCVGLIISICACLSGRKAQKKFQSLSAHEAVDEITTTESLQYDFNTIRVATDNFSVANKLGQGGFGAVYRGRLYNGVEIAVKRLSRDSGQGELEFKNEVLLVAKLQHRNLVRLLGFCFDGNEKLLVYEFVPNASLDHFIFDPMKRANLDWNNRYKVIGGVARGLLYLHEDSRLRIIHRDLKTSNILLDEEMNPKISDFGMARLFVVDQTQANTRRIVGTYAIDESTTGSSGFVEAPLTRLRLLIRTLGILPSPV